MKQDTISIPARFCGPPNSANGGYVAGRLAAFVGAPAEVTLKRPPPLETKMTVQAGADGSVELVHDGRQIAIARAAEPAPVDFMAPTFDAAVVAAGRTFADADHKVPGCFVCGPGRTRGDGLRIHVGPVTDADREWRGALAAPWVPPPDLAGPDGTLREEFVWAALDCPTAYACSTAGGMPPILLGRQTVAVVRSPRAGERCVIVSQRRGREGRKFYADGALFGTDGDMIAVCNAIWIEVSEAQLNGNA